MADRVRLRLDIQYVLIELSIVLDLGGRFEELALILI